MGNETDRIRTASLISPNTECAVVAEKKELTVNVIKHVTTTPYIISIPTFNATSLLKKVQQY